jgi:YhcH/YjgK/YiaL family protein
MVAGKEAIGIAPTSELAVEQEYDVETDVMFLEAPKQSAQAVLSAGGYVILYPQDAHRPGVKAGEKPVKVRKVVGKVRVMED